VRESPTQPSARDGPYDTTDTPGGSDSSALLTRFYNDLRALAATYFEGQPVDASLRPTDLVHEAYLKVAGERTPSGDLSAGEGRRWEDPEHFLAVAATAMRHVLVDRARARQTLKRGGRTRVDLDTLEAPADEFRRIDVLDLDSALRALAEIDARAAKVVELRFFGGLTMGEVAKVLRISKTTVESEWTWARVWLKQHLRRRATD
jgi:RNA polymerase sigma-70 factor, ECF subfamily